MIIFHMPEGIEINTSERLSDPQNVLETSFKLWRYFSMSSSHSVYLAANEVTAAGTQRAMLLSSCGASTYKLIKDMLSPNSTAVAEFDKIVEKIPPPLEITQDPMPAWNHYKLPRLVNETGRTLQNDGSIDEMLQDCLVWKCRWRLEKALLV